MNRPLALILALCLPWFLAAAELSVDLDFSGLQSRSSLQTAGWGTLTAPGYPQLPAKTVNIIIPPAAEGLGHAHQFTVPQQFGAPAPQVNPPFANGEQVLSAPPASQLAPQVLFQGIKRWGDVAYASFRVLPFVWTGSEWSGYRSLRINLSWTEASDARPNRVPPVLLDLERSQPGFRSGFFANPQDLDKYYSSSPTKNYDYLIISTPELYAAIAPLESFRQGQGLITSFANINTILATTPGSSSGEKLRNYLVAQYYASPFGYLLLVGDHDTVPVMYLTPEPDGYDTVASDFFYGDLSSIVDTDSDGRLGEYSPGDGLQDFLCDFTPEVFVGRISTNSAAVAAQIADRTVAYEQSTGSWKQHALLPAAFLNYQGEPETIYLQTDGAGFMEYARTTVLSDWQSTTMYEQLGVVPSYPSDYALDYDQLKNLLSSNSYGLLNWSAHGSSTSSSRKVWMNDGNANSLPDSWEMDWLGMVNRQSFDNLVNQDGLILFAASCYNGYIDGSQQCLAEYALQKKAVNVSAATRTGWYKIGWQTPGWGGLSSYNLHWLENITRNQMTVGGAQAYANLIHTEYYLFGDPVDAGGIIWPELQNVYTYLLYGDPAVGYFGQEQYTDGEILVYEPWHNDGLRVVNALNDVGHFNVVYTDKLIPDYDYLDRFEAVFCLFGWGDTAYILHSDSLDYALLDSYLDNGGKMYLEGDVAWDPQDPFWGKFATHAPLDYFAYIEGLRAGFGENLHTWGYAADADPYTQILVPYSPVAEELFTTNNSEHPEHTVGILHAAGTYATLASSFALAAVEAGPETSDYNDLYIVILGKLGVVPFVPVAGDDPLAPAALQKAYAYPNPFTASTSLHFELDRTATVGLEVFNLRGQKVHSLQAGNLAKGSHDLIWDGCDASGRPVSPGIYLWRLQGDKSLWQGKMLKLAN
ncbi:MAG: T9SS type A sorting domain-containing protein [Candidatus Syntrophosphaera sp.]|nr:T9SS type A sorting domain-containing protein [Candidatus Syntrophosphaera sp.]